MENFQFTQSIRVLASEKLSWKTRDRQPRKHSSSWHFMPAEKKSQI